jgi:phosphoribosyl 1,2-cyclic phosphodiesterase
MRVVVLASGSRGNATLFEGGGTRVLVDAGLSLRALKARLLSVNEPAHFDAIVITHAHRDHVGHCRRIAAKLGVPLYMSESTSRQTGYDEAVVYSPREPFAIASLTVTPTPLPHDAAQVALSISDGCSKAALCTDLGEVPAALPEVLAGADLLLLESNHDLQMLRDGPYPWSVKRRIASAGGHLSNAQAAELLGCIAPSLGSVVLMHLSESNNRPELALAAARDVLGDVPVALAEQDRAQVFTVGRPASPARPVLPRPVQLAFAFA